jgi:methylenetetrahydrofolate reductase (NADH)
MNKFSQMYGVKPVFSAELFPPKTEHGEQNLFAELEHLVKHRPAFVSMTYGAGGSTRAKTLELTKQIACRFGVVAVPHFTSVGASRQDVRTYVEEARAQGVQNLVALRGDPPRGETTITPAPDGFRYGGELIAYLRAVAPDFDVAVAGYPEGHVECRDLLRDVQFLKRKVEAGAAVVLTQLFYDNVDFFRFRDAATAIGIGVPIVPGIMPITKLSQIKRITSLCGARIPERLHDSLAAHEDGSAEQQSAGIDYAISQCRELLEGDVPGLHIFTLNSGHATSRIIDALGNYFRG